MPNDQPALTAGQVFAHYQILAPLGKGGMGEVYLADDTKLDRKVALKLLPAAFTADKDRLRRFTQEAKTASSLNHPNIITIHEIGEVDGAQFIATEFIDGLTLRVRMERGRMKMEEILDVSIQAASALDAAHKAGIIHRDIKPENIMVRQDGYVKVLDFGLAKLTETRQQAGSEPQPVDSSIDTLVRMHTEPGTLVGTVAYMSPEQARGEVLDTRTDVFSLGAVMYEMAAGRIAFGGRTSADILVSVLEKEPISLEGEAPHAPGEFRRIVSKALNKDRDQRYQSIKDLLIDLRNLKDTLTFERQLESRKPAAPVTSDQTLQKAVVSTKRKASSAVIVALAGVALAALAILAVAVWQRQSSTPSVSPAAPEKAGSDRLLSYWITVQKYRDGKSFQEPFRLRDDINFEKDYRIRLTVTSPESGYLYLLNEGPESADQDSKYNVLFPSETANGGSALLRENQQVQIPQQSWLQFDDQQGTEKIWVVWAARSVPELDGIERFANTTDRGALGSPGLTGMLNEFLRAHSLNKPTVQRDQDKKETILRANGEVLVYAIMLEHH